MQETGQKPECRVVRAEKSFGGKQGLSYLEGVTAESVGASAICMHVLTMPPGARAKAHKHDSHETAIYVIDGEAHMFYGDRLEHHRVTRAGDMIYVPPNVPHMPVNLSDRPCTSVIARTDPNEQESVTLLPELDPIADKAIAELTGGKDAA
ncbi:MAG: cupin domain-containing protein [Pseudomonadota bacterium]|nr:cupin domain-containing protein [Pseudomonadota bacterium]